MTRKTVQEERRIQILQALYKCIQKKSFAETSIKDIATKAGINHGVLHYYFKSKGDILLNFIDYIIDEYRGQFTQWTETLDPETVASPGFLDLCLNFMSERITLNKDLSRAFIEIWEIAVYNRSVRVKLRKAYEEWIDIITGVVKNTGLDEESALISTRGMIAFYEGLALFSIIMPEERYDVRELLAWFRKRAYILIGIEADKGIK